MSIKCKSLLVCLILSFLVSWTSLSQPSLGALPVSLSDQGTGVRNSTSGEIIFLANLTVDIYDSLTGGSLIYSENFTSAIANGSWSVMLGENAGNPLYLEYGKKYYKDYRINGEDASFTNLTGDTVSRQFFYSPLGDIAESDINQSTNLTIGQKITFSLGQVIDAITSGWARITGGLTVTENLTVPSGRVGIGTSSPNATLDVNGSIYIWGGSGDITPTGTINAADVAGISNFLTGTTNLTSDAYARADVSGDGLVSWNDRMMTAQLMGQTVGTDAYNAKKYEAKRQLGKSYGLYGTGVFYVNSSVGIKETAPSYTLTVAGSMGVNGTALVVNDTTERVGIGTSQPTNKLTVVGDFNATTNISTPMICLNGDCQTGWPAGGNGSSGGWVNDSQKTYTTLNVGIGTTNPATKLEVAGDAKISGNGYLYSSSVGNLIQKAANLQALPNTGFDTLDGWVYTTGGSSHNQIVSTTGPNGGQIKAYRVFDDDQSEESVGGRTEGVPFSSNATYRVSLWMRENTTGEAYIGVLATLPMINMVTGAIDNVPDFLTGNLPSTNTWYRLVAYIYPYGMSNSSVVQGGIYDTSGRRVSTSIKEFRFNSSATINNMSLSLYSALLGVNPYQVLFYDPRIEIASDFENPLFFGNIGTTGNLSVSGNANITGTLYVTNVSGGGSEIVFVNSTGSRALTIKSDGTMILDTNDQNKTKLAMNGSIYILGGNGDVNGNGIVGDATDRGMLINYFNGANLTEEEYARADVTGDGIVSRDDQMAIANILINNEAGSYENYVDRLAVKRLVGKVYGLNYETGFSIQKNTTIGTSSLNEPKAILNVYGSVFIGKNTTLWTNEIANSSLSVEGSIGIGISMPNNKLTVIGDINATTNISTPKICLNGDCQTGWPSADGTGGWTNDSISTNTSLNVVTGGNITLGSILKITPTAAAPSCMYNGLIYVDTSPALCYCNGTDWLAVAGAGTCA